MRSFYKEWLRVILNSSLSFGISPTAILVFAPELTIFGQRGGALLCFILYFYSKWKRSLKNEHHAVLKKILN